MSNSARFNSLPDVCVLRILSYFDFFQKLKLRTVDKRWFDLIENSWCTVKTLNLSAFVCRKCPQLQNDPIPTEPTPKPIRTDALTQSDQGSLLRIVDEILVEVFSRVSSPLHTLDLGYCGYILPSQLMLISMRSPNIKRLKLTGREIKATSLAQLSRFSNLVSLSLEDSVTCDDEEMALAKAMSQLNSLKAFRVWFSGFSGKCLLIAFERPTLRMLELTRCRKLQLNVLQQFLTRSGQSLIFLKITGVPLTQEFLSTLGSACPILERLWFDEFSSTSPASESSSSPTFQGLSSLKTLHCQCRAFDNTSLDSLVTHCPALDTLHIPGTSVDDQGLAHVLRLSGNLKDLDIRELSISDHVLCHVLNLIGPRLRCLDVSRCQRITSVSLETAVHCCKNLFLIDFQGCAGISSEVVEQLRAEVPMLDLRRRKK